MDKQLDARIKSNRAVDVIYKEANLDFRPEVMKILYRLHWDLDQLRIENAQLLKPKQTFPEFMQKNWLWIGGILSMVGASIIFTCRLLGIV